MTRSVYILSAGNIAVACAMLFGSGCASWFLNGAEMANAAPANPTAAYVVTACATPAGQVIPGPNATYYLAQEATGTVLYEIEANGSGARVTNSWADATGQYFFVWVGNGAGWQYFFPNDPAQTPIRLVFVAGTYTGDRTTTPGVTRPAGVPAATCVMGPAA